MGKSIQNIKYGKDLITLDRRMLQLRYVNDVANHGEIQFKTYPEYKWDELGFDLEKFGKENYKSFVKEEVDYQFDKNLDIKKMRILK